MAIRRWLRDLDAHMKPWLDEPDLLVALETRFLALAKSRSVYVLDWQHPGDLDAQFTIQSICIEDEHVSAIEWVVFNNIKLLAVGTSLGYLLIYTTGGFVIHRQLVYPGRILKLRVRGTKRNLIGSTSSYGELCVVIQPGIIARFDGSEIQWVLQRMYEKCASRWKGLTSLEESENHIIRYHLWNVSKYAPVVDAALTSVSPVLELLELPRRYRVVTVGADATISAFMLDEDQSRSFVEVVSSKVVNAIVSTIASFSKLIWMPQQPAKKPKPKPPPFARALPLAVLKDHLDHADKFALSLDMFYKPWHLLMTPLEGEKLTLSPNRTLAAITDSHGGIMLLDTRRLMIIRTWNGYEDATCLFVDRLENPDSNEHVKEDFGLCLAIHAPKKGILELWRMSNGPKIRTIACPKGTKILQRTYEFGSASSSTRYKPQPIFFLDEDFSRISMLS